LKMYFDRTALASNIGWVVSPGIELVPVGTSICYMSANDDNKVYQRYASEHDLRFIFEDNIPEIDFFAVPQLDVFARNSNGGFFATLGGETDIESMDAAICFISKERVCFTIAPNLKEFMQKIDSKCDWMFESPETEGVILYPSKETAKSEIEIVEMPDANINFDEFRKDEG